MNDSRLNGRRWVQFSLRSLLALMVVAGVLGGWLGLRYERLCREAATDHARSAQSRELVSIGAPYSILAPPSDAEVLQALAQQNLERPPASGLRIVKETVSEYVDPPRLFPMVGRAQLHLARFKCTVYADGTDDSANIVFIERRQLGIVGDRATKDSPVK